MLQYLAIIEKAPANYSAFLPDIPGCIATGNTIDETLQNLREALAFHFEGMQEDGAEIPSANGWLYHYNNGIFKEGEIGDTYLLANVTVNEPRLAA